MLSRHRIGTFRITRLQNTVQVRDVDKFNNWGCKYFLDAPTALAWAHWAQLQKDRRALNAKPLLALAA